MISALLGALLMVTVAFGICTGIAVGMESVMRIVWRKKFGVEAPADAVLILAYLAALMIAAWGVWIAPQFQAVYGSFGPNLPWPPRLVIQYRYLLVLPVVALALFHSRLQLTTKSYVPHILLGEFVLLVVVVMAMYVPVISFSEVVQ